MAFKDIRLPIALSYGASGGPSFRTDVIVTASGAESRNQVWQYERLAYECSYDARVPVDWKQMHAFFRVVSGRADTFRARDPLDYVAATTEGSFIATSIATQWQMVKSYTFGAYTIVRKITKPVVGTVTVSAGTVDYTTGLVTNGTQPTFWGGEFDVHCRFDVDDMKVEHLAGTVYGAVRIAGWRSIPIIEVRA